MQIDTELPTVVNHVAQNTHSQNGRARHGQLGRHRHRREHMVVTDAGKCGARCLNVRIQRGVRAGSDCGSGRIGVNHFICRAGARLEKRCSERYCLRELRPRRRTREPVEGIPQNGVRLNSLRVSEDICDALSQMMWERMLLCTQSNARMQSEPGENQNPGF